MKLPGEVLCQVFSSLPSKPDWVSCLLVCKAWAAVIARMTWANPFTSLRKIDILIECYLPEEDRQSIDMNLPCSNRKPMFDYPAYLETLNYFKLFYLVTRWIKSQPEIDDVKMRTVRRRLVHAILRVYARSHVQVRTLIVRWESYGEGSEFHCSEDDAMILLDSEVSPLLVKTKKLHIRTPAFFVKFHEKLPGAFKNLVCETRTNVV